MPRRTLPGDIPARYGPVALVTGASSGIGEAFARLLAEAGLDLLISARRKERLDALAEALRAEHGIDVVPVVADLAAAGGVDRLLEAAHGRDVGLVVSNAGIGPKGLHHEIERAALEATLEVNCRAPLLLAHGFVPRLLERGRGGFLLVGSIEAYAPTPLSAAYAASKAFQHALIEGIRGELRAAGAGRGRSVDIGVIAPGATDTEMFPNVGLHPDDMPTPVMTSEAVALEGIEALRSGRTRIAGLSNRLMVGALSLLPRSLATRAIGMGMRDAIEKGRRRLGE